MGSLAMGPFYQLLLSTLGWKVFLRILSCVAVIIFVSALLYRPVPPRYKSGRQQAEKSPPFFDLSVWRNKSYVFWVLSMFMLFVGYFVPFIHLVSFVLIVKIYTNDVLASLVADFFARHQCPFPPHVLLCGEEHW